MDYKGYVIQESYSHPNIQGGYKFASLQELLEHIDVVTKGLAKQKVEAKFIICQVPQGAVMARYCVETAEISFHDWNTWTIGKGHIYE